MSGGPVPLAHAAAEQRYGGKAANLARLLRAGVQTQPGLVLGVEVLQEHLARLGIAARVESFFAAMAQGGSGNTAAEAAGLRRAVLDAELPAGLVQAIRAGLEDGAVHAVRSSAPGEDGATTSFAGQFDSVLGCRSLEAVVEAVRVVWASLFSERAVAYAVHRHCAQRGMAVIIQRQVDATVSGVMFSRDPRNSSGSELLVEYCAGLGEKLVAGQVSPGRFYIHRDDGAVRVDALPGEQVTPDPAVPEIAAALRQTALTIELLYGGPQDVEWSLDPAGQLVVLQARPITTGAQKVPQVVWTNANIAENFPEPVVPMLRSFVGLGYAAYFRGLGQAFGISKRRLAAMDEALDNLVGCHGGRLYYNLSNIHTVLYLAPGGPWLARFFNQFTGAREYPEPEQIPQGRVMQALELAGVVLRVAWRYLFVQRALRRFERRVDAYAVASVPAELAEKSGQQLTALLGGFLEIRLRCWTDAALADTAAMVCYGVLQGLLRDQEGVDPNDLLKGLPGLASARPVERLWDLSRELRQDAQLLAVVTEGSAESLLARLQHGEFPAFHAALQAYFETWGFRSSGELMLSRPTPAEDPLPVLRLLKSYVAMDGAGPAQVSRRQAEARVGATQDVRRRLGVLRGAVFTRVLSSTQGAIRLRERARMKQALLYTRLRHVALALGERLTGRGVLLAPDDVLFLGMEEAMVLGTGRESDGTDARALVAERRAELADCMALHPPDSFTLPKGEDWREGSVAAAAESDLPEEGLRGTGACGGRTTGTAAVVLDVSEIDRIRQDQILVTRQTDPGWAAVFFMIKGLVIERGGLLSHGAIIAREYGIPAVVGVRDATRLIGDGEVVQVDGDRGRVDYVRD